MANNIDRPSLLALAKSISALTSSIVSHLHETKHDEPNFTTSSPETPLTTEYEALRVQLNTAATDLLRLVNGPKVVFRDFFTHHYELAAWQVALEFNYFGIVPLEGSISLKDLAAKAGMDEGRALQVMRFLATQRVFKELPSEQDGEFDFEHTLASITIAKEPLLKDVFLMQADEMFRAASSTSDSIRKSPFEITAEGSPFAIRHGETAYKWYESHPAFAARFSRAMAGVTLRIPSHEPRFYMTILMSTPVDRQSTELRDEFDWKSLPAGTIVDVAGGSGYISLSLAKEFPHLNFIIQDISPTMLAQGQRIWTNELASRVKFMQYDYFQPQPVHDATAFFTRQVTHNLTDQDTVRFFRSFVPALEASKPGTPLLVNDTVIPEPGEKTVYEEHGLRQMDLAMWIGYSSRQRTAQEFRILIGRADPRLKLVKIHSKGTMGLIELQLTGNGLEEEGSNIQLVSDDRLIG